MKTLRNLIAMLDSKGLDADAVYPPTTTELRLYAGLLAAYRGDRAGVAEALLRTEGSTIVDDYPTVSQLRQVVVAEQERLAGKPQAAIARLSGLVRHDSALVASHWALMRAAQSAGDDAAAGIQRRWLRTHRGRVFVESTTTDVLRFFNAAVSAEALKDAARSGRQLDEPVSGSVQAQ